MKVVWTARNTEHIAKHGIAVKTIEALFDAPDQIIVAGQPRGRWVLEATIGRVLYRVVFTRSGPGEVYPITAHRIRRRRKR